jgi:hypothetical protein
MPELFTLPLVIPRSTEYTRLAAPPEATAEEIRAAAARRDARLRAEGASQDALAAAHEVNLADAGARAEYDARFPPLGLLRFEPTWAAVFDERDTALAVLRREIEAFLAAAGERVFCPSDITRTDFTGDFAHCPLLDGDTVE